MRVKGRSRDCLGEYCWSKGELTVVQSSIMAAEVVQSHIILGKQHWNIESPRFSDG